MITVFMRKNTLILLLVLIALRISAQEPSGILDRIAEALPAAIIAAPPERVYVSTDKDIYSPGEVIWFKAWVDSRAGLSPESLSQALNVALYDASGQVVAGDRFRIVNGTVEGDLKLPSIMTLGSHFLAAYTQVMSGPEEAFIKPVCVYHPYDSEAVVRLADPGKIYAAGENAAVELEVTGTTGNPADRYAFLYKVTQGERTLAEGKSRSSKGKAAISFPAPQKPANEPVRLVLYHPRNLWVSHHILKTSADELNLIFYPEGGAILPGVVSKTGFYVTSPGGIPVEVEADVTDTSGKVITKTKTFSPGFGLFPLRMEAGQGFRVVVTSEYGQGQSFNLPLPGSKDFTLNISRNPEGLLYADIYGPAGENKRLAIALTGDFSLEWAAFVDVNTSGRIFIPAGELTPGVKMISLFDDTGLLLAQRLVMVSEDRKFSIQVTPEITDGRMRVTMQSTGMSGAPAPASVSVSIAGKASLNASGPGLQIYRHFVSELVHPSTLSAEMTEGPARATMAMDYILLANRLKSFSWDRILKPEDTGDVVPAALRGVRGRIVNKRGEAAGGIQVSLFNSRSVTTEYATTNASGDFFFPVPDPVTPGDYSIAVADARGSDAYFVEMEPNLPDKIASRIRDHHAGIASCLNLPASPDYLANNPGLITRAPVVRPASIPPAKRSQSDSYLHLLQSGTHLLEVIKMIKPFTIINGQIVFPGTQNSFLAQTGALIILDKQQLGTNIEVLNSINPNDVESINISLDPASIQQYTGLNNVGIIEITTKRGGPPVSPERPPMPASEAYMDGFRVPRSFLTTESLRLKSGKDLRTTLYWNPALELGPDGKATFSVPLSEIKSDFVITVEGVDREGVAFTSATVVRIN